MHLMPSGCFYGLARHRTGGEVSVLYQVKKIVLKSSSDVFVFQRLKNERFSQWDCLQVAFLLYDESVTFFEIKNLIYSL